MAYFTGTGKLANILAVVSLLLALLSQLLNYHNYRCDREARDLRLFAVISGRLEPKRVGITEPTLVLRLTKKSRNLFNFANIIIITMTIIAFILFFLLHVNKVTKRQL